MAHNRGREGRRLEQFRGKIVRQLGVYKKQATANLRPLGLRLQGYEVRGWRTSPIRGVMRWAKSLMPGVGRRQ
jgi:hypothetical protein